MKSSLAHSVLIIIATIFICLVDVQSRSSFEYETSDGNSNKKEGGGDVITHVKLLPEENVIPMSFLKEIDEVSNMSEFFEKFVALDSTDPKYGLEQKIGKSGVERASLKIAKASGCYPESTVVQLEPLVPSTEPSIFYFPKCTRVNRCSGCCSSHKLSCQPVEVETLDFTIFKLEYTNKDRMPLREQEHVLVEQHKKCKCDCKVKKEHCNSYQVYDASQCLCNCTNYDAKNKCLSEGGDRIWDSEACKCSCKETQNCTTGTLFDEEQCKCTEVTGGGYSSKTLFDRRRFIVKAVPVEPSNKTIYDINGK